MIYGDFRDFLRRAASDELLRDNAYDIAKNPKYDGYQRGITSMVYKFSDKKSSGANTLGGAIMQNQQLAEELHKSIVRKFEKRKVYSSFKEMFWVLI